MKRGIRVALWVALAVLLTAVSRAHGLPEEDKRLVIDGHAGTLVWLGAKHMLTGYDHLLFLFGVMFFLTRLRDVLKLITAFTLGHSITLLAATLAGIKASSLLVDAAIALTVCYKGFENLNGFRKLFECKSPNAFAMVFAFGLVHGFGLSTRIQEINLDGQGLTAKILAFNVGVEVGQLMALSVIWLFLAGWRARPSFRVFSRMSNVALMLAGTGLFLFNVHGYLHVKYPGDFPLNRAAHARAHKEEQEGVPLMPQEDFILPQKGSPEEPPTRPELFIPKDN